MLVTLANSSYSTSISSKAASAIAGSSAMTAAIGSPTYLHFVDRDNRLIFVGRAVFVIELFNIVASQGGNHPGQFFRFGGIDFQQASMRHGTPKYLGMAHARQLNVACIDGLAGHLFEASTRCAFLPTTLKVCMSFMIGSETKATVPDCHRGRNSYLRIFGLSFSGK